MDNGSRGARLNANNNESMLPMSSGVNSDETKKDPFSILPFGINYYHLIEDQANHDPYYEYFDDPEQEKEVADRCDITQDAEDANQFFDDPTVYGLLKEWYDGRYEQGMKAFAGGRDGKIPRRHQSQQQPQPQQQQQDEAQVDEALPQQENPLSTQEDHGEGSLRPTWSSVYGQVEEENELGDRSNINPEDDRMFYYKNDRNVWRLVNEPYRGRKRKLGGGAIGRSTRERHAPKDTTDQIQPKPQMQGADERPISTPNTLASVLTAPLSIPPDSAQCTTTPLSHEKEANIQTETMAAENIELRQDPPSDQPLSTEPAQENLSSTGVAEMDVDSDNQQPSQSVHAGGANDPLRAGVVGTMSDQGSAHANDSAMETESPSLSAPARYQADETSSTAENTTGPVLNTQASEGSQYSRPVDYEEGDPRFAITSLEYKFQDLSLALEDSKLRTLAFESRFQVPIAHQLPVNFMPLPPRIEANPAVPVSDREIIVSVAFHSANRPSQRIEECLFLGSQPLTALRDQFYCLSDFLTRGPDEPRKGAPTKNTKAKKVSNSFIFIEGVFYTDSPLTRAKIDKLNEMKEAERARVNRMTKETIENRRKQKKQTRLQQPREGESQVQPHKDNAGQTERTEESDTMDVGDSAEVSSIRKEIYRENYKEHTLEDVVLENAAELEKASHDYSKVIMEWVDADPERKKLPQFERLQSKQMHDTLIQDLSIRLNHPYLLVHQGNCEHIIIFRDLRLVNKDYDDMDRSHYPRYVYKAKSTRHKCRMCNVNPAYYITIDDRLSGSTPCYFCERCYDNFHYDQDGSILYDDFRVFVYAQED